MPEGRDSASEMASSPGADDVGRDGAARELADPTSLRGLAAGVYQSALYAVAFGALLGLAVLMDVVRPAAWPDRVAAPALVGALVGGVATGGGWVGLAYASGRLRRAGTTARGRAGVMVGWWLAFVALLVTAPHVAVFGAAASVAGRVGAHAWLFVRGR